MARVISARDCGAALPKGLYEFVGDPRRLDDWHAAVHPDNGDMRDGVQALDQRRKPARRHHQRVAAGQDHFPYFRPCTNVAQRGLEFGVIQRFRSGTDLLAAEAETGIYGASMQGLQ